MGIGDKSLPPLLGNITRGPGARQFPPKTALDGGIASADLGQEANRNQVRLIDHEHPITQKVVTDRYTTSAKPSLNLRGDS